MKRFLAILTGLGLIVALTIGTAGAVSAAPAPPFTISPTSLSYTSPAGNYQWQLVTVTTGRKAVVLESPTTFGSGAPFLDSQLGTCWASYGAIGLAIPMNTNCTVEIGFHPTAVGSYSDVATIYSCKKSHVAAGHTVCDVRDGSRTVSLSGQAIAPTCSYTPGTTGCIVLTSVSITDSPSTATYTISGNLTFTPTCQSGTSGCSYDYPNIQVTGSGTFSVTGSQTASGTWTVPAPPNDLTDPVLYFFSDAGLNPTTCSAAAIRAITFRLPLVATNGDTGGSWLEVRTDDAGTSDVVGGIFSTGPLPTGTFRNPADSQAGVTILC